MRIRTAVLGLCLAGCGPSADEPAGSASGGGSGAQTEPGGSGSTAGQACEDFAAAPGEPVMIQVRNDRAEPIFVDGVGCGPGISISQTGAPVRWRFPDCNLASCDDVLAGECAISCADCASGILRLIPGGVYDVFWDGAVFEDVEVPLECAAMQCEPACHRALAAPSGSYEVLARVFTECPLEDPTSCECPGGDQDGCFIFVDGVQTLEPDPISLEFSYPEELAPILVVGP